jgi:Domain of unknown function (DUF3480)
MPMTVILKPIFVNPSEISAATGASFIVFNGALKSSAGLSAKSSIVEDGLMVQVLPDSMQALCTALREMKDFVIACGPSGAETESINVQWVKEDRYFNVGYVLVQNWLDSDVKWQPSPPSCFLLWVLLIFGLQYLGFQWSLSEILILLHLTVCPQQLFNV